MSRLTEFSVVRPKVDRSVERPKIVSDIGLTT